MAVLKRAVSRFLHWSQRKHGPDQSHKPLGFALSKFTEKQTLLALVPIMQQKNVNDSQ